MSEPRRTARRGTYEGPLLPVARVRASNLLGEAVAGLLQRPGRSLLTAVGTVLGIGSFIAILGLSSTASGQIDDDFSLVQATQVTVRENPAPSGPSMPFPLDTTARLMAVDGVVGAGVWWKIAPPPSKVAAGLAAVANVDVYAVSPGVLGAAGVTISSGRTYDQWAEDAHAKVALLSPAAANQLGVGDVSASPAVVIGDDLYTVVGLVADAERLPQLLTGVLIPTSTATDQYGDPGSEGPATVLVATRPGAAQTVADQVAVALRPDRPTALAATAPAEPEQLRGAVTAHVSALAVSSAIVALAVGAVSIANITLVAVVERTGEIGLRRALGARRRHIAQQFLAEAAVLGGLGGLVGTVLALATILGVSLAQHWTPLVAPLPVIVAPAAGVVVGVIAGIYPALRAARVVPAQALQR